MTFGFAETIAIDAVTVAGCLALLLRHGRLGHSHPATIYLVFHLFSFSWRLIALALGAVPLFAEPFWPPFIEPVQEGELTTAALMADGVLVAMTFAWLAAARTHSRHPSAPIPAWMLTPVRIDLVRIVAAFAIPIGFAALLALGRLPGLENATTYASLGSWQTSSYLVIVQSWAGLALIALIYLRGFRRSLSALMLAYLAVMAYQGFHRYRVIIPSILLIQIYLERHRLRWPTARMLSLAVLLALLFFPLKSIGRAAQAGATWSELSDIFLSSTAAALSGSAPDQKFLDQLAAGKALVDRADVLFLGTPYLAIFTLPVPRQWWPEKPTLSAYMKEFSSPSRPMLENGMVLTFIGDLYANFSYPGALLGAPLLAYFLARFYFLARRSGYWSIGRFAYLMLACNLIQVYRDGVVSIVMFTVVNMAPLTIMLVLHLVDMRRTALRAGSGRPA